MILGIFTPCCCRCVSNTAGTGVSVSPSRCRSFACVAAWLPAPFCGLFCSIGGLQFNFFCFCSISNTFLLLLCCTLSTEP